MTNELCSIIQHYFPLSEVIVEPVPFGLTNSTCFVTIEGNKYVARHYNRYTKSLESLLFELNITSYLLKSNRSFKVPSFLHTKDGDNYVTLSDGTLGVLVSYLQGKTPVLNSEKDVYLYGRLVGEVCDTLRKYIRTSPLTYEGIPFTDLYKLHQLATERNISSFWNKTPFPISDKQRFYYNKALSSIEKNLTSLLNLPRQLVHHDLLIYNLLAIDGSITGVLDFDFLAIDISFMEFVICLNHVLQLSGGSLKMAAAFIQGYSIFCKCTSEEILHLHTLTHLYHIAVLHIYIGQYEAGKDISHSFYYIIDQLIERDQWLEHNRTALQQLFSQ